MFQRCLGIQTWYLSSSSLTTSNTLIYFTLSTKETNKWEKLKTNKAMPSRYGHSAVLIDKDTMLVFGGLSADSNSLSDLWAFNFGKVVFSYPLFFI
mgnify:CR=1 FL=1